MDFQPVASSQLKTDDPNVSLIQNSLGVVMPSKVIRNEPACYKVEGSTLLHRSITSFLLSVDGKVNKKGLWDGGYS